MDNLGLKLNNLYQKTDDPDSKREIATEIKSLISDVFREEFLPVILTEIRAQSHKCRFGVSEEEAKQVDHCLGMMADVGDGSLAGGIELIRDNHKWMKKQRVRSEKVSTAFFVVMVTSIVSGMLYALWEGVRTLILSKVGV